MECVCGCGRNLSKDLADRNYIAASVAIELLVWDKNRALPGAEPEGREGLIARGVECYERLLYSLHGEGAGDPDPECDAWLDESRAMRAKRSDMTKGRFFGGNAPNVSKEDMARIDRRHPERTFTGGLDAELSGAAPVTAGRTARSEPATANGSTAAATASPSDDLVAQLERLRTLRDEDVLTDEEFAAAKARLLGRD
jgi:hypothetical protein